MAQRCTACHVKSGKTCDGCVFRGLFPFAEQGKADFKALSEVYSIDFLRSSLVSMDRDQKEIFISSLLFELEQQRIYPDGGAGQAIQNADNQTFDYDQRDIEANELLRYSRQRSNLFNRSLQRHGSHDGADESRSFDMNILEAIQKSIESAKGPFSVVKNTSEILNLESSFEDRPGGDMNKQAGTDNIFARQSSNGSGGSAGKSTYNAGPAVLKDASTSYLRTTGSIGKPNNVDRTANQFRRLIESELQDKLAKGSCLF
ncbi:RNA-directed DNA polymerase, eukaryota, reverse transcriptase zinc-binding domain protein [Tanacetum coccineum]|uniref:RNA-directed DNA polymerase, eukaryota, reverse transcriptase zinc-binding domain protein n=1 Tax=Tanacetum coccineum TaxID=301880 RepID=A0ABQ4X9D0_9ASTR